MKLKNKRTGEIAVFNNAVNIYSRLVVSTKDGSVYYDSLAELCEEWEDAPDDIYYSLSTNGNIHSFRWTNSAGDRMRDELGNKFSTEDEAREAVKRLCAWKRLKDKGFKFKGWSLPKDVPARIIIEATAGIDMAADLDLLFLGDKE